MLAVDEGWHSGNPLLSGVVEGRFECSRGGLVGEGLLDESIREASLGSEFPENVGVTDITAVLPERVEDTAMELCERLGMFFTNAQSDSLGIVGVDVLPQRLGQFGVVLVGEALDVLSRLLVVRIVFPVVDGVVDGAVRSALPAPEVERMPLDFDRLLALVPILVEGFVAQITERTDVIGVDEN